MYGACHSRVQDMFWREQAYAADTEVPAVIATIPPEGNFAVLPQTCVAKAATMGA
jgi:hypothetical protein